jgi:hypothetical protein
MWAQKKDQNTFSTLLAAKLKYGPSVNAVQGLGCVLNALWIMLWTELQTIPQIIDFNVKKNVFFGYWHYMHKMIM